MAPTATMDPMSSPDPLADETVHSSVSRVTRSMARGQAPSTLRSQRGASARSKNSPRKQTFELDVGDHLTPHKIRVTVEADESVADQSGTVNRRLFPPSQQRNTPKSPSRLRERTTTTTIPLRGLTDDEAPMETPRKRGRPRKSGTPMPTAGKKRAGDELDTPRPTRRARSSTVESASETGEDEEATAKPKARKTPARRAKTPAKKAAASTKEAQETGTAKKRGRPRRQVAGQNTMPESIPDAITVENAEASKEDRIISTINVLNNGSAAGDEEEDMWLATAATLAPEAEQWRSKVGYTDPPSALGRQKEKQPLTSDVPRPEAASVDEVDLIDFGDVARSDTESQAGESVAPTETDRDTIADGEDFSIIMMDSIVSFRESRNYQEQVLPEMGEATSLIVDRVLEPIRQGQAEGQILQEQDRQQQEGQHQEEDQVDLANDAEDTPSITSYRPTRTFASTPAAATVPGNSVVNRSSASKLWSNSPRRGKIATPLSRQLALKTMQRDELLMDTPLASRNNTALGNLEESTMYDDSFSEIPEEVLEAATPRPPKQYIETDEEQNHDASDDVEDVNDERMESEHQHESDTEEHADVRAHEPFEPELSPDPVSDFASKLLTPAETPPPSDDNAEAEESEDQAILSDASEEEEEMNSSPPLLRLALGNSTSTAARRNSTETTPQEHSSPKSPLAQVGPDGRGQMLDLPPRSPRPALSPIVRVGRALQHVTSDPPSPKRGDSLLRSPFRSSGTSNSHDALSSYGCVTRSPEAHAEAEPEPQPSAPSPEPAVATQPMSVPMSERSWAQTLNPLSQIRSLVSQGAQMFSSPRFVPSPSDVEDPFGPDPDMPKPTTSFRPGSGMSSRQREKAPAPPLQVASNQTDVSVVSIKGDRMEWEPSESPTEAVARRVRSASASSVFVNRSSLHNQDASMEPEVEDAMDIDKMQQDDHLAQDEGADTEEEDEDDIWAIEADRPIGSPRKQIQAQEPTLNRWGSGKLPSPWTKPTTAAQPSRTMQPVLAPSKAFSISQQKANPGAEPEEFSLLSVQSRDTSQISLPLKAGRAVAPPAQPEPPKKTDLSAFFSSPANVPGMSSSGNGAASGAPQRQEEQSVSKAVALQGLRRVNLPAVQQKAFQPNLGQPRRTLFSSPEKSRQPVQDSRNRAQPPTASKPFVFSQVAQKMNFTPLLSKASGAASSFFGASVNSRPAPPRASKDNDIYEDEEDIHSSSMMGDDTEADESSFTAPVLKPLPDRNASPTKSCLRSPLKPKTPGPVVEFSTGTLSPLAQEEARAARRAGLPGVGFGGVRDKTSVSAHGNNKENTTESSTLTAPKIAPNIAPKVASKVAPPPARQAVTAPQLSQTQWTRAHWVRLDMLLQERRRGGSLNFQLQHIRGGAGGMAGRRRSAALLGKHVSAQGETMALEQWHLDVVDAFMADMGEGCVWDEHVLAKRLFALLVGEERRRARSGAAPMESGIRA